MQKISEQKDSIRLYDSTLKEGTNSREANKSDIKGWFIMHSHTTTDTQEW